jgi:hypothetical protein
MILENNKLYSFVLFDFFSKMPTEIHFDNENVRKIIHYFYRKNVKEKKREKIVAFVCFFLIF